MPVCRYQLKKCVFVVRRGKAFTLVGGIAGVGVSSGGGGGNRDYCLFAFFVSLLLFFFFFFGRVVVAGWSEDPPGHRVRSASRVSENSRCFFVSSFFFFPVDGARLLFEERKVCHGLSLRIFLLSIRRTMARRLTLYEHLGVSHAATICFS